MNTSKNSHGKHERIEGSERCFSLRGRAAAAIASGALVLTLCPLGAFAIDGPQAGAPQEGGNTPAMAQQAGNMQQAPAGQSFNGQQPGGQTFNGQQPGGQAIGGEQPSGQTEQSAPQQAPEWQGAGEQGAGAPQGSFEGMPAADGQQAPDMTQAPEGLPADGGQMQAPGGQQPGGALPADDALASQVRQFIADNYGIVAPADMSAIGSPSEAPEIPEGEFNVQAVIDSVRDMIRQYGTGALNEADFTDQAFLDELASSVMTATEQRLAQFEAGMPAEMPAGAPAEMPQDQAAPTGDNAAGELPAIDGEAPEAPTAEQPGAGLDQTVLENIANFIVGLFTTAKA